MITVEEVLRKFDAANAIVSDLLGRTTDETRTGRELRGIDLLVASGIREVAQGRRANRSEIFMLVQIGVYNSVAVGKLQSLLQLEEAKPFAPQLTKLGILLREAIAERPAEVRRTT